MNHGAQPFSFGSFAIAGGLTSSASQGSDLVSGPRVELDLRAGDFGEHRDQGGLRRQPRCAPGRALLLQSGPNNYIWFTREGVPLPTGTYSATARRGFETPPDLMYAYYESNTVWVKLKDGTLQRTRFDTNLNPWRNQFL